MVDPVDAYGELLFGRRIRLRVLLWVADQAEPFNQSQAARGVAYSSSGEVAKELERLVELGMLRKYARSGRIGPQNYARTEHPGWGIAHAARSAVEMGLPEPTGQGLARRPLRTLQGGEGHAARPRVRNHDSTTGSNVALE